MVSFARHQTVYGQNKERWAAFNFRLAQLRVLSKNTVARLKGRWRIFRNLPFAPSDAGLVERAFCSLNNFVEGPAEGYETNWSDDLTQVDVEPTLISSCREPQEPR
jgi:hypothetical protein